MKASETMEILSSTNKQIDYIVLKIGDQTFSTNSSEIKLGLIKGIIQRVSTIGIGEQQQIWIKDKFKEGKFHKELLEEIPFEINIYFHNNEEQKQNKEMKKMETKIEEENINWIEEEEKQIGGNRTTTEYEKKPYMKFEENKVTEIEVDFSKPFQKWQNEKKVTSAIIPVVNEGISKTWFLNIKNPLYADIIHSGRAGINKLKILRTGQQEKTRYIIVK